LPGECRQERDFALFGINEHLDDDGGHSTADIDVEDAVGVVRRDHIRPPVDICQHVDDFAGQVGLAETCRRLSKLDVVGSNPIARFFGGKMGARLRESVVAGDWSLFRPLFLAQKQGFRFRNVHKRISLRR
jgi:hypothetical protein